MMILFLNTNVYFSLKISTGKWPVMYARLGMNKGSRIVNFNFKEFLEVLVKLELNQEILLYFVLIFS